MKGGLDNWHQMCYNTQMALSETIHIRIDPELRDWLEARFSARGDLSWLVRHLLESLREQWNESQPVPENLKKAIAESTLV